MGTLVKVVRDAQVLRARQQAVMNNKKMGYKMRLAAVITMDTRKGVSY